jgi:hypothetical protein
MKIFIFGFLLFFATHANGQWRLTDNSGVADTKNSGANYSLNVGSQLGSAFNGGYFYNNYFSPSATINTTGPITLIVAVGAAYTHIKSPLFAQYNESTDKNSIGNSSLFAYVHGIYKVSPKMHLNASVLMEENTLNIPSAPDMQNNFKEMHVGINYKVAPSVTINAQFGYSNRPFYNYSPSYGFGNGFNSFQSPFYW